MRDAVALLLALLLLAGTLAGCSSNNEPESSVTAGTVADAPTPNAGAGAGAGIPGVSQADTPDRSPTSPTAAPLAQPTVQPQPQAVPETCGLDCVTITEGLPTPPPNTGFEPPETGFEVYTPDTEPTLFQNREIVSLEQAITDALSFPEAQTPTFSVAVWIDGYGELFTHNPEQLLYPASNQKLLTAAGSLSLLPADHRFTTSLRVDGTVSNGVLNGNLILVLGGDPTLTSAGLQRLADALVREGITHIQGDIIMDVSRWDNNRRAPGWLPRSVPWDIGPLSAFILDRNAHRQDDEFVENPNWINGQIFASILQDTDITIDGALRQGPITQSSRQVAFWSSDTVSALTSQMLLWSDNLIAEALVREIAYMTTGVGSHPEGMAAIQNSVINLGVPITGQDGDGSGLSRQNLHTGREIMQVLGAARGAPWYNTFRAALPVAGTSGTLWRRLKGDATVGNVRAKTGTITNGIALSGYVTTSQGDEAIFSILVNGPGANNAVVVVDAIVTAIAESNGFDTLAPVWPNSGEEADDTVSDGDADETTDPE